MTNIAETIKNFLKTPLESTFKVLGENPNSAIYIAVAIAAFKGLFRPIFTLTDKESDQKTKKYTAMREFLTEIIAIPVYITVPKLGEYFIVNKKFKNESDVVKKAAGANIKFWGVLASTAIIPAVCNLVQPPIMNWIKKKDEAKKTIAANNQIATVGTANEPSFKSAYYWQSKKSYSNNYGMRVGS